MIRTPKAETLEGAIVMQGYLRYDNKADKHHFNNVHGYTYNPIIDIW